MRWTLACAALAGVALLVRGGPAETAIPSLAAYADGSLSLSNSRAGGAIFSAANLAPGHATVGTVTLTNTGSMPGALALSQAGLNDVPGPGGGPLSGRLDLLVRDVTVPGAQATLYAGKLAAMPVVAAGGLPPGASRTFSFNASLPDGNGDNAFAGALMSVRYVWTLAEQDVSPAEPDASPEPPRPAVDEPPRIRLRVPRRQRVVTRRRFVAYVRCNEPCRITSHLRVQGHRRSHATRRLRTPRLRPGRWARLSYRLPTRSVAGIRQALRHRRWASLRLVLVARDDAGNARVMRRRVKLRRVRAGRHHGGPARRR